MHCQYPGSMDGDNATLFESTLRYEKKDDPISAQDIEAFDQSSLAWPTFVT